MWTDDLSSAKRLYSASIAACSQASKDPLALWVYAHKQAYIDGLWAAIRNAAADTQGCILFPKPQRRKVGGGDIEQHVLATLEERGLKAQDCPEEPGFWLISGWASAP